MGRRVIIISFASLFSTWLFCLLFHTDGNRRRSMNGHVLTFPIDLCVYDLGKKILSPNGIYCILNGQPLLHTALSSYRR